MRAIACGLVAGIAAACVSPPIPAGERPAPTCCRPQPQTASCPTEPRGVLIRTVAADAPLPATADRDAILAAWAKASAAAEPLGEFDRRRIECAHGKGCTAHELAVVCELHGPVQAADLSRRYHWSRMENRGGAIRLTIVPTDPIERMFVPECTVTLDAATHLPTRVEFPTKGDPDEPRVLSIAPRTNIDRLIAQSDAAPEACGVPNLLEPIQTAQLIPGVEEIPRRAKPVSPEVARMLKRWEQATAGKVLHAEVRRFTYDLVFHTERRAGGEFRYEGPGAGRLELRPVPVGSNRATPRRTGDGRPYELKTDHPQAWTVRDGNVTQAAHEFGSDVGAAAAVSLAHGVDGDKSADSPVRRAAFEWAAAVADAVAPRIVPLVTDVRAERLQREFSIERLHETPSQVWLRFEPQSDAARFREVTVILDKQTWLPLATKSIDPAGNTEIVHTFRAWTAEAPRPNAPPPVPPAPAP